MGVFDKFKDLVGIEEYDDDDITEEEIRAASMKMERQKVEPRSSYSQRGGDKVVPMQQGHSSAMKLVVIEPDGFEDCPKLVDSLKERRPVIINLERLDSDSARKIFDFLSGATYALNGNVQKVANNIFVFAPANVDISADALQNKGFDFNKNNESWR